MIMTFVNSIFLIWSTFSAPFFVHHLIENKRRWGCSFYTVTIVLDLNNFLRYQCAKWCHSFLLTSVAFWSYIFHNEEKQSSVSSVLSIFATSAVILVSIKASMVLIIMCSFFSKFSRFYQVTFVFCIVLYVINCYFSIS